MTSFVEGYRALLLCSHDFGLLLQSTDDAVYGIKEILFAYRILIMACSDEGCLIAYVGNVGSREAWSLSRQKVYIYAVVYLDGLQVYLEDLFPLVQVGQVYADLAVEAAGAE